MKKVILCAILLAAMFSSVQAAPFQTLGMLRTPDAYVLPHKAAEFLLVGYYRDIAAPAPQTQDAKDASKGVFPYGMIGVGILDRIELGLFAGDVTKADGMVYFLNAKVKIIEETLRIPQISVGMDNILSPMPKHGTQYNDTDDFTTHPDADCYEPYSPYLVASKQAVFIGIPWMFNLGIGSNRFVGQVSRSRMFTGIFTSAEMSPVNNLSLQSEWDGEDFNVGVKYSYKNFGFKLGAAAVEDLAKNTTYKDNLRIAFGLSYLFDKYAEAKRRPDLGRYADSGLTEESEVVEIGTNAESEIVVPPTETGAEVVVVPPVGTGTQLQTPGLVTQGSSGYKELSPEVQDLLAELKALKEERQKAQQAMDDLRKWIQELKKP
jgi:hypothetical protein